MNKMILGAVALITVAGAGWYFASPSMAMAGLRDAALEGDKDELAEIVDFPAVRDSIKSQFKAQMAAEMAKEQNTGFAVLGAAFAMNMVDTMIDGVITPEGIKAMVENGRLKAKAGRDGADAEPKNPAEWEIERVSFDKFRATPKGEDKAFAMVFKRDGLGWDLTEIDLPDNLMDKANAK
jgi:hypothetical protein